MVNIKLIIRECTKMCHFEIKTSQFYVGIRHPHPTGPIPYPPRRLRRYSGVP